MLREKQLAQCAEQFVALESAEEAAKLFDYFKEIFQEALEGTLFPE